MTVNFLISYARSCKHHIDTHVKITNGFKNIITCNFYNAAFLHLFKNKLTEEEHVTSESYQISESSNISTSETKSTSSSVVVASTTHVVKQGRH